MKFLDTISTSEHDAFVRKHKQCDLLQSSAWAQVKQQWHHEMVGVKEGEHLIATCSILQRKIGFGLSIMYLPRGPVMDYMDASLCSFFIEHLKAYAKKKHCVYITLDPLLVRKELDIGKQEEIEYGQSEAQVALLKKLGCQFKGYTTDFSATIQSRFHAGVYVCEDIQARFTKHAQKALRSAKNKHVNIRHCGIEGVEALSQVIQATEHRKHIRLRDRSYFEKIVNAYGDDACITLAYLSLPQVRKDLQEQIGELDKKVANINDIESPARMNMLSQIKGLQDRLLVVEEDHSLFGDELVIAGNLTVAFGPTSEILYAGMNDRYKRYMAPYAVFYHAMLWSFAQGCTWCNMGGVEGEGGGLIEFKSAFSPTIKEYIGEFDIVLHPLYHKGIRFAMSLVKLLRHVRT